jgi:hypothetical protein
MVTTSSLMGVRSDAGGGAGVPPARMTDVRTGAPLPP